MEVKITIRKLTGMCQKITPFTFQNFVCFVGMALFFCTLHVILLICQAAVLFKFVVILFLNHSLKQNAWTDTEQKYAFMRKWLTEDVKKKHGNYSIRAKLKN